MAFWTCNAERTSGEHAHDFDEYMIVVKGRVDLFLNDEKHVLKPGDEIFIFINTRIRYTCVSGTRTIHAFDGRRAEREE